jgi:hypothetical protein
VSLHLRWFGLAASLAACAPSTPDVRDTDTATDTRTCDALGGREHWLVTELRWSRVTDGVSDGFDLDGDEGTGACGGTDLMSPSGAPGIDNAFGALLPILESTEFSAAESIISELIRTGEILIVVELAGLDDLSDDDCVSLAVRRGLGAPMLGTDGDPLALQTLDLDLDFEGQAFSAVPVIDGSVEGRPVFLDLPVAFLGAELLFEIQDGGIRADLHEDGTITGVVAGGLNVDDVVETIQNQGVADDLKQLADTALRFAADLAPDASGACTQLSLVLDFEAQPVFVYDDVFDDEG